MWITFYFCGKAWCNVDNFVDRMRITSLFLNLFEIKQNELIRINMYNLRSIQAWGRISTALFYSRQVNFLIKNILHFWTMCNCKKTLITPRVFYISKKSALVVRRGMCSTLTYHSNFNLPTTSLNHPILHPKYPKIIRELLRRTFEKSFISNNFQLP